MRTLAQILLLLIALLLLCGCRTRVRTIEVERVRTEYQDRLRLERDSVYLHDSVYIVQRGDTVYHDRWHIRYKEVLKHDTAYIERRDSISYPVVVEVERPRPWYLKVELYAYRLVVVLLLIYIGWHSIRTLLWRRKL